MVKVSLTTTTRLYQVVVYARYTPHPSSLRPQLKAITVLNGIVDNYTAALVSG